MIEKQLFLSFFIIRRREEKNKRKVLVLFSKTKEKGEEMKKRILTGIFLLAFFVPLLLFADNFVFRIAFTGIAIIALCEVLRCIGTICQPLLSIPLGLFVIVSFMLPYKSLAMWSLTVLGIIFYCMATIVLSNRKIGLTDVATSVVPTIYLVVGLLSFVLLRERGDLFFWLVLIGAWGCDTFAYIAGKFFGKKKLVPEISPNKTIAGAVGGALSGMILFLLFALITKMEIGYISMMVLGIISAMAAQLGDLMMSAVKREYNIKDFSNIFPGHGGVLDRFDSILMVAPVVYLYIIFA